MSSRTPRRPRRNSNASLWSMREVSPSPAVSPDPDLPSPTASSPPSTGTSTPRSRPPKTPIWWLTRTQKYSSYAFLTFLTAHFASTGATPLLTNLHTTNNTLLLIRDVLHQPAVEAVLIPGALGLHLASGLTLRLYRQHQLRERYGSVPANLSVWRARAFSGLQVAGWVLAPLVVGHAVVARALPWWVDGDSSMVGVEWVGYGFRRGWWGGVGLAVWYAGMVGAGVWHVVGGLAQYWGWRRRRVVRGAVVAGVVVWLGGLVRVVRGSPGAGWRVRHYESLHRAAFGWLA